MYKVFYDKRLNEIKVEEEEYPSIVYEPFPFSTISLTHYSIESLPIMIQNTKNYHNYCTLSFLTHLINQTYFALPCSALPCAPIKSLYFLFLLITRFFIHKGFDFFRGFCWHLVLYPMPSRQSQISTPICNDLI